MACCNATKVTLAEGINTFIKKTCRINKRAHNLLCRYVRQVGKKKQKKAKFRYAIGTWKMIIILPRSEQRSFTPVMVINRRS